MRRSPSEPRAAWGALLCAAFAACSAPDLPPPPPPPAPLPSAAAPAPPAPEPSPSRRRGRTLLAEPQAAPLDVVLQPIPGGRSALAIAQHAGEREAWARRLDASGAEGPLVRFVDEHVFGAIEREGGALTFVTSDGARVCFRGAVRPACVQSSPAAVVPVGDRIALLEIATAHPPPDHAAPKPHPAPKPAEPKHTGPRTSGKHPAKAGKKKGSHAAPAHHPSHPLVELFVRWLSPDGAAEPEAHTTGLHFEAPLDGMTLADARARPPGVDVLWYETAQSRKTNSPLGSARLMAASLRADGSLDFGSRVAVADADLEYGQLKDHRAPRLAGDDAASVFLDLDAKGQCEVLRARPTLVHLPAPPPAACAVAPDRLAAPLDPGALAAFERILADEPRRAFGQPRGGTGLVAWAGERAYWLHGRALRSATLPDAAPRDEPAPFPARRARMAWGAIAPDGEAIAYAGETLLHLGEHIDIVPVPPGNVVVSAPELPPDRRRAARIADTWWTARGTHLQLWPAFGGALDLRHEPDTAVLVGGRDRGLSLELVAGALHLASVDRAGIPSPLPAPVPSPVRVGFDACERSAGGALVAGVSASDPAKVVAFTVDAAGRAGDAHPVPLPIRAGELAVRLVALPAGGALLTDLDRRHVVWISDDAVPLADAAWPASTSDAVCPDGRPMPLSVPAPAPGEFVALPDVAEGACIVGDPVWARDGSLHWLGGTVEGLDFYPESASLLLVPRVPAPVPVPVPVPVPAPLLTPVAATASSAPPAPPPRACPPDMVLAASRFCVDRFEAMIVDARTGAPLSPDWPTTPNLLEYVLGEWAVARERTGNVHARAFPLPFLAPERLGDHPLPLAVSRLGVRPSGYLTGVVAEAACAAAGKRLCSLDEFVTACRGQDDTLFPYGDTYEDGVCNVFREEHPAALLHGNASVGHLDPRLNRVLSHGRPLLQRTGESPACRSRWGDDAVYDMVGNLDEWVDEGSGAFAGGFYSRATRSGCEALVTAHPKAYTDYSTGVRCCRDLTPPASTAQ